MKRTLINYLNSWLNADTHKPLILRGARQVGKTWLVRYLSEINKRHLIELNFEKTPSLASFFDSNDPQQILLNISAAYNQTIEPANTLLFLDEIQAAPHILAKLRWFAEELPALPVIAAGSLLEFVLAEHSFSMPVGRITYAHLEPLSFEEFLLAMDKSLLVQYLADYQFNITIPLAIHEQLSTLFKEYLLVGGLPAAVSSWISERALPKINQIHHELLTTYRDDFAKYSGRIPLSKLDEVMMAIPRTLAQKFIFSRVNPAIHSTMFKQILDLLGKARICHRVISSAANGVPLGAELRTRYFKEIFLDTGLACAALGINFREIQTATDVTLINKEGIAEQVVGQLLRTIEPPYIAPDLHYWHRDEKGSSAEVDYVIAHGSQVVPVEVKAGSTGTLKSLHLFMGLKQLPVAIRINSDFPSKTDVCVKNHAGEEVKYTLLSLPFYLTAQVHRLLEIKNFRNE